MPELDYQSLAALADLAADHPLVRLAEAEHARLMKRLGGEASEREVLRQRFPGITDNMQAQECARTIAGWKPLPLRPVKRMPKAPRVTPDALTRAGCRHWSHA